MHNLSRYAGVQSGGLLFVVHGVNFDAIQSPQFFIESNQKQILMEVSDPTDEFFRLIGFSYSRAR